MMPRCGWRQRLEARDLAVREPDLRLVEGQNTVFPEDLHQIAADRDPPGHRSLHRGLVDDRDVAAIGLGPIEGEIGILP